MSTEPVNQTLVKPRVGDGTPGPGRPKGSENKATTEVRQVIRRMLEQAGPQMEGWLEEVAKKDPAKALELVLRACEYAIPKMRRTELAGSGGGDLFEALRAARERASRPHENPPAAVAPVSVQAAPPTKPLQQQAAENLAAYRAGEPTATEPHPCESPPVRLPPLADNSPGREGFDPRSDNDVYRPF